MQAYPVGHGSVASVFRQESVPDSAEENSRYRHVYIMYFMEDGTLGINEPKVENSGLPQGNFLKRQKVEKEDGTYIGPDDFQIGSEVTICGHTFHICGCDRFTRWFFEENGVAIEEARTSRAVSGIIKIPLILSRATLEFLSVES